MVIFSGHTFPSRRQSVDTAGAYFLRLWRCDSARDPRPAGHCDPHAAGLDEPRVISPAAVRSGSGAPVRGTQTGRQRRPFRHDPGEVRVGRRFGGGSRPGCVGFRVALTRGALVHAAPVGGSYSPLRPPAGDSTALARGGARRRRSAHRSAAWATCSGREAAAPVRPLPVNAGPHVLERVRPRGQPGPPHGPQKRRPRTRSRSTSSGVSGSNPETAAAPGADPDGVDTWATSHCSPGAASPAGSPVPASPALR